MKGRFGQPMTPQLDPRINEQHERQTAYCPPREGPFIPSIGSSVHMPVKKSKGQDRQNNRH
jgi:hypothetical protein